MTIELKPRNEFASRNELEITKEKVRDIPVCLIIPPSQFLADERVFPFLGILKVAAELRKNGNSVDVLDLSGYSNFPDIAGEYARKSETKVFGITATTPQIPNAVIIRDILKKTNPHSQVILGGPHATLTYTAMLTDREKQREGRGTEAFKQLTSLFDKLVVGDGEMAVFPAIDKDNRNKIIDASNINSPNFIKRGELDNFSFPARDFIDLDSYHYYIDGHRAFSVIAQLGCPFECGFCGGRDSQIFRLTRTRSVENVTAEIEEVVTLSRRSGNPFSAVMFYDDELNVLPSNLEELCLKLINLQEKLGMEMRFRGFVKAEIFTPEQARLMYKAGFRVLLSGVESGSDKILTAMKKHTNRVINTRCVEYAHEAGLAFKALMSTGHPGESKETIKESVEWALSSLRKGDDIDWTIITEYPGSPYFDHSVYVPEKGVWLYETKAKNGEPPLRLWSQQTDYTKNVYYYKGIPGNYTAYVWTDYLDPQELVAERDRAEEITRKGLGLEPIKPVRQLQFEHSMGQGLPTNILRRAVNHEDS